MLEGRHITHAPDGKTAVLHDVSLTVAPEERVALVAPSGAGKTTLCRILAGYLQPDSGEVLVDGAPLPRTGRCPVQLIGQHPELALDPRMTVADSLAEAGETDAALLERVGVQQQWMSRYPRELSGGELQRICIARALLARPRYLVADEMTTSLDALTQARIWSAVLEELAVNGTGLLMVTHSPALTRLLATRVVQLGSRRPCTPTEGSSR